MPQTNAEHRTVPEDCAAAMQNCQERRPDASYSRVRFLTAAVAAGNAILPANSLPMAFSYGIGDDLQPAFAGDATAVAAALTAAGVANPADTDLNTAKETEGDFYIDHFSLIPLSNSDARFVRLLMPEVFLDIQFNGKTVKRLHSALAPAGAGLAGAGESFTAASAAAQSVSSGPTNGFPTMEAIFPWKGAPMVWRGIGVQDKLTVVVACPRAITVPSGGTLALLADMLVAVRGVKVKDVAFERT